MAESSVWVLLVPVWGVSSGLCFAKTQIAVLCFTETSVPRLEQQESDVEGMRSGLPFAVVPCG